ncbi:MAG: TauD/TfdA family dioxygenase [Acidimicrobiaceae bacterium]|jgi:taurine dioxygenase|nr:TauD/TfdA family dioxygenase [Acidimicrobiaceae bacterium]MBT5578896.1 TauD/TfdA family dioxygenase [Acidimicrobiaceae bacterium]
MPSAQDNQEIITRRLSGAIGAEVTGVRLAKITDANFAEIRQAFHEFCMLVFPGQFLTIDEHVEFASRWGEFSISPFVTYLESHPAVLPLHNRGKAGAVTENWHTDSAFLDEPPALNVLSARDVPVGGDTMWSNQYNAYERLSDGMKAMLDGMRGEFTGARLASLVGASEIPRNFHPIVRTHPETGRRSLYISKPVDSLPRFEGMTTAESVPLLNFLYQHSVQPDNVHRHHWQTGDVVMWDNRCTMHYAVHDYGDDTRDIHRVSIKGSIPR